MKQVTKHFCKLEPSKTMAGQTTRFCYMATKLSACDTALIYLMRYNQVYLQTKDMLVLQRALLANACKAASAQQTEKAIYF